MYSLLMRANKLETVLSRDRLACLPAPPDFFHVYNYIWGPCAVSPMYNGMLVPAGDTSCVAAYPF